MHLHCEEPETVRREKVQGTPIPDQCQPSLDGSEFGPLVTDRFDSGGRVPRNGHLIIQKYLR